MRILSEGVVFAAETHAPARSATFPLTCVTPWGRWYCTFRCAPSKLSNRDQRVLMCWSDDQGQSWQGPDEPFHAPDRAGRPGRLRYGGLTAVNDHALAGVFSWVEDAEPDVPYFNEETEGLLDTRILITASADRGASWTPLHWVDTAPLDMPTPITGPILALPSGEWLLPFELNKPYYAEEPWQHAAVVQSTPDQGKTWQPPVFTAQHPDHHVFYWDQRVSQLPDGLLLALFWTFDRVTAQYRNIHAAFSRDHGRTWSTPRDTGVPGQPGPAFTLPDGTLAMPYVDRTGVPEIRVVCSVDAGESWRVQDALTVHRADGGRQTGVNATTQDAWAEMTRFSLGLPHAAGLPGGGALLVYYAGPATDDTAIRWAVIGE